MTFAFAARPRTAATEREGGWDGRDCIAGHRTSPERHGILENVGGGVMSELCYCPKCGRSHRRLEFGRPPPNISGELSHDDYCHLSRLFNHAANLGLGQDQRINRWLQVKIAAARCAARGWGQRDD